MARRNSLPSVTRIGKLIQELEKPRSGLVETAVVPSFQLTDFLSPLASRIPRHVSKYKRIADPYLPKGVADVLVEYGRFKLGDPSPAPSGFTVHLQGDLFQGFDLFRSLFLNSPYRARQKTASFCELFRGKAVVASVRKIGTARVEFHSTSSEHLLVVLRHYLEQSRLAAPAKEKAVPLRVSIPPVVKITEYLVPNNRGSRPNVRQSQRR